jgi:predicted phage terminase large subunit-like protein
LLDVLRRRWEYPDLLRSVKANAERHQINTVLIEDANSGAALIQSLRQETRLNIVSIRVTLDKITRAAQHSAAIEAGRVLLPEQAPWLAELERELLGFPSARHDDQVDSMMQFLRWAAERARYEAPIGLPIFVTIAPAQEWSW